MASRKKKPFLRRITKWAKHKFNEMLFYKDFDMVFFRNTNKRHSLYLMASQKVCQECGSKENLTIDHIIPFKLDGNDKLWNKQLLCLPCNSAKGHIPYSINKKRALMLRNTIRRHQPLSLSSRRLVSSLGKLIWRKVRRGNHGQVKVLPARKPKIARKRKVRSLHDPNRRYELRQRLGDGDNLS